MLMKKWYKRSLYLAIAGAIVLVMMPGCADELLTKNPRGERTQANFFQNAEDAVLATNGTYEQLRNFAEPNGFWSSVHYIWLLGLTDIASDDANKGTEPTDGVDVGRIDNLIWDPNEGPFNGVWEWFYRVIFRANTSIENIPNIDMDETLKDRLIGENKFLRAYSYFFLVRAWGGVPLVTKALEPSEFNMPRSSAEEVYALIEQDLIDAAEALPRKSEYPGSQLGRATKGAAQGLLAKVHLFQDEYADALRLAEEVINSGEYSLMQRYGEIFTERGENGGGSLFEIQAVDAEDLSGRITISNVQGVRGQIGWGFVSPERDLMNAYEPGDTRMQSTVLFVHETYPQGPPQVVHDHPRMIDERYNQKTFRPTDQARGNLNSGTNLRRLRFADVLLIAAEAAYHTGNIGKAQQYTNMIRERARDGQTATIGAVPEALSVPLADAVEMPALAGRPFVRWANEGGVGVEAGLKSLDTGLSGGNIVVNHLDVIEAIDGVEVSSLEDYFSEMRSKSPGQTVTLDVLRVTDTSNTDNLQLSITAQELLPDITSSGQALLEAIWHERRIELALEQHRMFDIRRQGRDAELLRAQGKPFDEGKHELFPISRREIDVNPAMTQNPGY